MRNYTQVSFIFFVMATVNTVGCVNWNPFCNGDSETAPGGVKLDSRLTCKQTDFVDGPSPCRNEIVPAEGKTAKVTFQCSSGTMKLPNGEKVASESKVMDCNQNAREWKLASGSEFTDVNSWPSK